MLVLIVRHGIAIDEAPGLGDEERYLTPEGRRKTQLVGVLLRKQTRTLDRVLTSPLVRAAETAEIVSAVYENTPPPQVLPALATGVAATEAVTALRAFAKHEDVMIVGHEPQLSAVASILLTGASDVVHLKLKTGGCVAIDLPARFERGGGELRWLLTHKQLRTMRK